jgi:hypothetical protein
MCPVEILFGVTPSHIPYVMVLARSILRKTKHAVRFHCLYANNIATQLDCRRLEILFDKVRYTIARFRGAKINFYDISEMSQKLDG